MAIENIKSKWITFKEVPNLPEKRKTKIWDVIAKEGGVHLGKVTFFPGWRNYAFVPQIDTIFEHRCLNDIAAFIVEANAERRRNLIDQRSQREAEKF